MHSNPTLATPISRDVKITSIHQPTPPKVTTRHQTESFGFKSTTTPPQSDRLNVLENDLYEMVKGVVFRMPRNNFQSKMKEDVAVLKSSTSMLIPADKTTNLYEMSRGDYQKLFHENVTKHTISAGTTLSSRSTKKPKLSRSPSTLRQKWKNTPKSQLSSHSKITRTIFTPKNRADSSTHQRVKSVQYCFEKVSRRNNKKDHYRQRR